MSEHWYDDSDTAHRVPKVVFMVKAKGKDPQTNRAKTWLRIHTSKADAKNTLKLWEKYNFLDVELVEAETEWREAA